MNVVSGGFAVFSTFEGGKRLMNPAPGCCWNNRIRWSNVTVFKPPLEVKDVKLRSKLVEYGIEYSGTSEKLNAWRISRALLLTELIVPIEIILCAQSSENIMLRAFCKKCGSKTVGLYLSFERLRLPLSSAPGTIQLLSCWWLSLSAWPVL